MGNKVFFGLVRHRDCLALTWRGWLLLVLSLAVLSVVTVRELYPFLAVTEPVESGLLVVEGWVSDVTMEATIAEFKQHRYEKVYVTGGPIEHTAWLSNYKTFAERGAATLLELGLSANEVQAIPSKRVRKDRTNAAAAAFSKWMKDSGAVFTTVHLITEGAHARRSRLLFQRALGSGVTVGVTSFPGSDYDPEHWWQSSAGVREVVGEMLAYGYARFLFWLADE
ncbi:YdcF family protein [bacterium]|nr:MAG: YdcF family protein [bacterium]